ncbi:MAG: HEAT repeat domain-containing protein [Bryobacteraceae bacterium]
MKSSRKMITIGMTIGGMFLTAALALAQVAPVAPTPPTPAPAPAPQAAPAQPATPWPGQLDLDIDVQTQVDLQLDKLKLDKFDFKFDQKWDAQEKAFEKMQEVQDNLFLADGKLQGLAFQLDQMTIPRPVLKTPTMPPIRLNGLRANDPYQRGLEAIDAHHYDEAVEDFNQVVAAAGPHTEGGLYWKAYTLNKLGRSADALAAIDQLRKTYPGSRWLDDAKALEVEVKQSSGKAVSPEAETDEDIKILALNGLMQSDPERALPQVENLLKTSHSPKLKRQAIIVLGLNSSPRARQDLEQIARGGNPDLQLDAIRYLARGKDSNYGQLFAEIYAASSDVNVKRAILSSYSTTKDKDRLLQIAKTEKNPDLRNYAIGVLGEIDGQPEIWQIYQSETTPEAKASLLGYMRENGSLDKLVEVARTDKDPKVRMAAVHAIAWQRTGNTAAALVSVYTAEQDAQVKRAIVDDLAPTRNGKAPNGKALVDLARAEKDPKMKLYIVNHLSHMAQYSKEAQDYLQEILSK